ncbi:hypothetical protein GCM10010517_59470 [Streptosporangium fragile]|uniref:Heparinase II/III-like C-terminal domain-containing protein n=1 Tax=Streptosporangium fragile TaxID=46186 RepID=A0ABN3W5F8_9ACTN
MTDRGNAPYSPDWARVRRRVATRPWAAGVLAAVREDFSRWARDLVIPGPDGQSAWAHTYFCDADGAPLTFGVTTPERHVCPQCGRTYTGDPWDGAWRTKMHNAVAAQAQRAALLVRLSEDPRETAAARGELERIFATYSRDYLSYEPHGANAGQGRVQPQCLDEAVWAVGLLRALRWAGDVLTPATSAAVDDTARVISDLLRPQFGLIHNIRCWLVAALAECAARLRDEELLAWCRDSEFGAEAQIREGFHPEGLWYEINPHYHYYAVSALLSYREAAGPAGLSAESALRLSRAITAPPHLAYSDTRLPAYGDGWPECYVGDFAPQAEAAWTIVPEEPVDLAPYYTRPRPAPVRLWSGAQSPSAAPAELTGRSSVAALVFGPDDIAPAAVAGNGGSFVWPHAGIGLLRSTRVRLAMRFGPDSGWHDHRDKLNVDVETATGWSSLDLGTSGYGSEFTTWMRSPVAHNLVIVDGRRQPEHAGRLLESSERHLVAESAWDGHVLRRAVSVDEDGWTDEHTAALAGPGGIEWVFHGDGAFTPEGAGAGEPVRLRGDVGHDWLRDACRLEIPPDRRLRGAWSVDGSPRLVLTVPDGFEVYTAVADGNPTGRPLGVLLLRGYDRQARFRARFRLPTS